VVRFFDEAANGVGWTACAAETVSYGAGSSAWTIGGSMGSPFYQGRWWSASQECHAIVAQGAGYLGEARDWDAVWLDWRDVVRTVVDIRLDTQDEVDARAEGEAASSSGSDAGGVVRVGLVPGLEVGDVVTVTDELAGLADVTRFVRGIVTRFELWKGVAEQELELVGMSA
jgi:hypothetical protein